MIINKKNEDLKLKVIKREKLGESVARQVMELIQNGTLKAGEKVPTEIKLIQQLGVSRTSVREGMQRLEILGVIEIRPGQGTFVCQKREFSDIMLNLFSLDETIKRNTLLELLEIRKIIEVGITSIVAERSTDADKLELKESLKKHRDDVDKNIFPSEYDISFHLLLAKATKNKLILNFFSSIFDTIAGIALITGNIKENGIKALKFHEELYEAIVKKNPQLASKIMREHIDWLINLVKG